MVININKEAKELYTLLKEKAGKRNYVQVAQVELGRELGITQGAVCNRFKSLKRAGLVDIKIQQERGRPNLYILN